VEQNHRSTRKGGWVGSNVLCGMNDRTSYGDFKTQLSTPPSRSMGTSQGTYGKGDLRGIGGAKGKKLSSWVRGGGGVRNPGGKLLQCYWTGPRRTRLGG